MLTFFRRIRKGLLGDDAISKYLLYAIGEIALVVIGILIALQINNWNEKRKQNLNEKEIVIALYDELKLNKEYVEGRLVRLCDKLEHVCRILLQHTGKNHNSLPRDSFNKYLERLTSAYFIPKDVKLEQVINGDDFEIITNDSMRLLLANNWQRVSLTKHNGDKLYENYEMINQYLNENYTRRDLINNSDELDRYKLINDIGVSSLKLEYKNILNDPLFENLITDRLIKNNFCRYRMNQLNDHIDIVLDFIENNYEFEL